MTLLSMLLAAAIGCLLVMVLRPAGGLRPRWAALTLELALGAGCGMAVTSILYFLLLLAGVGLGTVVLGAEATLLAASGGLLYLRRKRAGMAEAEVSPGASAPAFRWNWLLALVLAGGLALVAAAYADTARLSPHGNWDAWGIWNLRAKFLAGPEESWNNAISPLLEKTHPGYPLLLSGFVGRVWKSAGGGMTPAAPLATAFLCFGCVLALLLASVTLLRGAGSALFACLVLLATTSFVLQPPAQYADVPLAFYYLAVLVLVLLASEGGAARRGRRLVLAGACASFAAWTKDEGVVFLLVCFACLVLVEWRGTGWKEACAKARWFALGAGPGAVLVGGFKLLLAPPDNPLGGQTLTQALGKLVEVGRYGQIIGAFFRETFQLGGGLSHPLILLAVLAYLFRFEIDAGRRKALLLGGLTVGLVFAGYCGVYLLTTSDLAWHLGSSFGRLICQLWPCLLLLAFLVLGRPGEAAVQPAAQEKAHPVKKARKRHH